MTIEQFCSQHPRLYHMASVDSLPQIEKHGLLSSERIVSLIGLSTSERNRLCGQRRPESVLLTHPIHGRFTLRDQKPLRDEALRKCLDGMSVSDWYRTLNARVFMWVNRGRLEALLGARAYRKHDHLLLTINSSALLRAHFAETSVSTINSGATLFRPVRRGIQTFVPLARSRMVCASAFRRGLCFGCFRSRNTS